MAGSNPCREAAIAMLSSVAAAGEVDEDILCMRLRLRDIEGRIAIFLVEYASGLNAKQAAGGASTSRHFMLLTSADEE